MHARPQALAPAALALALALAPAALAEGELTPLPGKAACNGKGRGCTASRGLGQAGTVAVSTDGRSVYVGAVGTPGLGVFARNKRTGALRQRAGRSGCIARRAGRAGCTPDSMLGGIFSMVVSPDGRNAYTGGSKLTTYTRSTRTGALRRLGAPIGTRRAVAISPDGRNVYAGSAPYARDASTGALTPLPGPALAPALPSPTAEQTAVSADGRFAYLFQNDKSGNSAVLSLAREPATGALTQLTGACLSPKPVTGCQPAGWSTGGMNADAEIFVGADLAVTRDGRYLVVALNNGFEGEEHLQGKLGVLARDSATGALTPAAGGLQSGGLTDNFNGFALSPDGATVYQASDMLPALQALSLDAGTGKITGAPCYTPDRAKGCKRLARLDFPAGITVSPDGRNAYLANASSVLSFKRR